MDIKENIILAPYTTFHIGGPADYFLIAKNTQELMDGIKWAEEKNILFFILGSGANILVGDKGFRGLVIKNESSQVTVKSSQEVSLLTADSGITIAELITITTEKGLSGLEHFAGIPSTLGGAIWQNLHFLSADRSETVFIGDILETAIIIPNVTSLRGTESDEAISKGLPLEQSSLAMTRTVNKDYFKFAYDYSILHDTHDIVLSATLKLKPESREVIKSTINANLKWRAEKHPENAVNCSAGSIFKKIPARLASESVAGREGGAGRFIQQVGLKGHKIGGAQISEKHANFIINAGNAKASEVLSLINLVKEKVKKELGLDMETEISLVGEF